MALVTVCVNLFGLKPRNSSGPLMCKLHVSSLSLCTYRNYAQVWRPESCDNCFDGVKNRFFPFLKRLLLGIRVYLN